MAMVMRRFMLEKSSRRRLLTPLRRRPRPKKKARAVTRGILTQRDRWRAKRDKTSRGATRARAAISQRNLRF
jgi:hypothetical protein